MRLLLIDDHPLFVEGLATVLREKLESCHVDVFRDSSEAMEHLQAGNIYDLILLDLHMPQINGFCFIDALQQQSILIPVVILSATDNAEDLANLRSLDIAGFVPKSSDTDELFKAIYTIMHGNVYISPQLEALGGGKNGSNDAAKFLDVTPRQLEVLTLLSNGHTNVEIAKTMGLSRETIKSHMSTLFSSLGVNNRVECLNKARRLGLVS